jgi:hypothetical protein
MLTIGDAYNQDANLGARVLEVGARLEKLRKQARRTPPRTLLVEREKVSAAKIALDGVRAELDALLTAHATVRSLLGRTDDRLSDEYLAIRAARMAERHEEMTSDG